MTCREPIRFFSCCLMIVMLAGRTFLHSCAQRLGLQRLSSTIAMRVILSAMMGKSEQSDSYCTVRYPNKKSSGPQIRNKPRGFDPFNPIGAALIWQPQCACQSASGYKPFATCSARASESLPVLMAKGSASKDKKKPSEKKEKSKGKAEETITADKGGKVRPY